MCVCVTNNVHESLGCRGMQKGAQLQQDSTIVILSPQWTAACLDFGGGDSQADQSAGGIAASCVLQDLVDEV